MRSASLSLAVCVALLALAAAGARASDSPPLTTSQVATRFKAATKAKLLTDKASTYPGHYAALSLPPSVTNQARYGRFILYVVGPAKTADDVEQLLADGHTGVLGTPAASRIYWEQGQYLTGGTFWLGKKQYGPNIVLWWYGTQKKVAPAFARLHKLLTQKVVTA
jgi:hypothetical protein